MLKRQPSIVYKGRRRALLLSLPLGWFNQRHSLLFKLLIELLLVKLEREVHCLSVGQVPRVLPHKRHRLSLGLAPPCDLRVHIHMMQVQIVGGTEYDEALLKAHGIRT